MSRYRFPNYQHPAQNATAGSGVADLTIFPPLLDLLV